MTRNKGKKSPSFQTRSQQSTEVNSSQQNNDVDPLLNFSGSSTPSTPVKTSKDWITPDILSNQLSDFKNEILLHIKKNKDEVIDYLTNENLLMKAEIIELKESLKSKELQMIDIEKRSTNVQQYVRRNNIEISGIDENISDDNLESKVIEIANCIGVKVKNRDIEACHRLKSRNSKVKNTIVRFINRKIRDNFHRNKNNLKSQKESLSNIGINNTLYINNNLCPYNKFLWSKCKKLFNEKLITRFWVFNGNIFIAPELNDDNGMMIDHLSDLKKVFPGYDFESKG